MDTLWAFKGAHDTFAVVLQGVRTDQLDDQARGMEWQVRDLPAHITSVTQHIGGVRVATGIDDLKNMHADIAAMPTVEDLVATHAEAAGAAYDEFAAAGGLTREYELTWWSMSFPGDSIAPILAVDVLTHAWDLARSTGQSTDFDDELTTALLVVAQTSIATGDRTTTGPRGVVPFAEQQPCDPDRPAVERLAAYLGRSLD